MSSLIISSSTHATTVFLLPLISVVAGIPATQRDQCPKCPEDCEDEFSHPGCEGPKKDGCDRQGYCKVESAESMAYSDDDHTMEELEATVYNLQGMVAVLLALVLLLLLAVVLIILKLYLPSVFKCFKRRSDPDRRRPRELTVSTIRLANHQQSSESPRLSRISNQIPHSTPVAEDKKLQSAPPTTRARQPSESTCPDESTDTHQGYDNLGLSTSTLHNQSTSSTSSSNRSLGGVHSSTRTMNTTLPDHTPHHSLSTRI